MATAPPSYNDARGMGATQNAPYPITNPYPPPVGFQPTTGVQGPGNNNH